MLIEYPSSRPARTMRTTGHDVDPGAPANPFTAASVLCTACGQLRSNVPSTPPDQLVLTQSFGRGPYDSASAASATPSRLTSRSSSSVPALPITPAGSDSKYEEPLVEAADDSDIEDIMAVLREPSSKVPNIKRTSSMTASDREVGTKRFERVLGPARPVKRAIGHEARSALADKSDPRAIPSATKILRVRAELKTKPLDDSENGSSLPLRDQPSTRTSQQCSIKPASGKGLGLFADVDIAQGSIVIAEKAILEVDHPPRLEQILNRMTRLSTHEREVVNSFTPAPTCSDEQDERLLSIIERNVIPLGGDEKVQPDDSIIPIDSGGNIEQAISTGLFEHISRVNHSCIPNTRWIWDVDAKAMILRAVQPIQAGTELTACYLQDTVLPFGKRQRKLHDGWAFKCGCPKCSLPKSARRDSDGRLIQISKLGDKYIGLENEEIWHAVGLEVCVETVEEGIQLLKEEQLDYEIPSWYATLFYISVRWGDEERAKLAGRQWLEELRGYGEADPDATTLACIVDPTVSAYWAMYQYNNSQEMDADDGEYTPDTIEERSEED